MPSELGGRGLTDALVILGAAGIVIPAFARFRISPVIGFILIGLLVGPAVLGSLSTSDRWLAYVTISDRESIAPFAELGIILLLFSAGLELSFQRLWSLRRLVFGVGIAELVGAAAVIAFALWLLGSSPSASAGIGLALALSSTALVLPLTGTQGPVGRSALSMLLLEDLALVPIIFAIEAMAPYAASGGFDRLFITVLLGVGAVAAMLVVGRFLLPHLFAQAARTKSPEIFLAASLVVVIAASLITSAIGLSPILGALVAGILIAETDYRGEVEVMTAPIRGLGLGIFLITVGMSVDVTLIAEQWQALLLAVVGVLAAKTLVTALLLRVEGARRATAIETAFLMGSPSETTLIVLATATAGGLITREASGFWQLVTAIGLTVTPLLAKLGRLAARRVDTHSSTRLADALQDGGKVRVVILGFGRVGQMVAEMLGAHSMDYVAIDSDADAVAAASASGFPVLFGDVARPELLARLQQGRPSALILTMDNPVLVARLAKRLRQTFPDLPIVARARDTAHAARLYKAGVTDAVPETLEASLQLSEAALVDLGVAMGPVIASIHEKRDELRAQIKAAAEMEETPRLGRRRARDAQPAGSNRSTPPT
jgi:CPA2 family monovalent cation:H+ antiporter-2